LSGDLLAAFDTKFQVAHLEIAAVPGWVLSVRPGQLVLGSMVLSLRSGKCDLAALDATEAQGLVAGLGMAETLVRSVYGAVRINALCLMMQDPIVHFHLLPRYDAVIRRHGLDWTDADWPGPPMIRPLSSEPDILKAIRDELRAAAKGGT
jgi:diadenosine tetraphosphate (Ap4A) HIT family hydrolase